MPYYAPMSATYFHNSEILDLPIYDAAIVQTAFENIAIHSSIEFNFPQGGCQQRAQLISMLLEKKFKITHYKIWLFAPVTLAVGDTRTLFIDDVIGLTPNNKIEWNYHVAPVLRLQVGNTIQTMVIDPSINIQAPILLVTWLESIGNSEVSKYSFLSPKKYFFYCCYNSNNIITPIFDGTFFDYEPAVKENLTMEKGLAMNDLAIAIFHKYIKPLKHTEIEAEQLMLHDLKSIFGNTTALDLLFSQNTSGTTDNTTHRYVMTHYSTIMQEARILFSERLAYWTNFTNTLL
jgi:hypothetical protein